MKNEILILLPAYNEELNVRKMVESWMQQEKILQEQYNLQLKIVIINDGSKDKTEMISNDLCREYPNVRLINHLVNKGLGQAVKTALLYAVKEAPNSKYACVMDCDNTQDPKYITNMLDKIGDENKKPKADVIIASRYRKGSQVQGVAKYRLLTSEGAKYVYSALLPVKNVRDYTCGYRLYSIDILRNAYQYFGDSIIEEAGFTCMAELLYKLHIVGAVFDEIPFVLRYDFKQGNSKMKVLKTAINSFKLAFHLRELKKQKNNVMHQFMHE